MSSIAAYLTSFWLVLWSTVGLCFTIADLRDNGNFHELTLSQKVTVLGFVFGPIGLCLLWGW